MMANLAIADWLITKGPYGRQLEIVVAGPLGTTATFMRRSATWQRVVESDEHAPARMSEPSAEDARTLDALVARHPELGHICDAFGIERTLVDMPRSDDEALAFLQRIMAEFGWTGTVMTRADVELVVGRELTEDEWANLQGTKAWRDAASTWSEAGVTWDTVYQAIHDAGVEIE